MASASLPRLRLVAAALVAAAVFVVEVVEVVEPVAELVLGFGLAAWLQLVVAVVVAAAAGVVALLQAAHSEESEFAVVPSDLLGLHYYLPVQRRWLAGLPFAGLSAVADVILVSHEPGLERIVKF